MARARAIAWRPAAAAVPVRPAAERAPAMDAIIAGMTLLTAFVMLAVSPFALNGLGWNYDGPGGSGPTRFHPASYLMVLTFLLAALRDGNPLASVLGQFGRDPGTSLFLAVWAVLFYHATSIQKMPAATLIDSFLVPILFLMVIRRQQPATRLKLAWLVHGILGANALLGLAEFLGGFRLTPYLAGGVLITGDWRSSALLGHPLANALTTGMYAAILIIGGAKELQGRARAAMLVLQFAAMIAFGGRASIVILALFAAWGVAAGIVRFLAGLRLKLGHLALIAVLLPSAIIGLGALYELGFFDKFLLRFTADQGSANARLVMFELFDGFTTMELLFGPPQELLGYLIRVQGVEFGIESLWVAFVLYYGAIPSLVFFMGLFAFLISLMREVRGRAAFILLYFFAVNSTFLGIAGKSLGLANLMLLLLALLPRGRSPHASSTKPPYAEAGRPAAAAKRDAPPC